MAVHFSGTHFLYAPSTEKAGTFDTMMMKTGPGLNPGDHELFAKLGPEGTAPSRDTVTIAGETLQVCAAPLRDDQTPSGYFFTEADVDAAKCDEIIGQLRTGVIA